MGKNGVDAVYTADPNIDPTPSGSTHLTYRDALRSASR